MKTGESPINKEHKLKVNKQKRTHLHTKKRTHGYQAFPDLYYIHMEQGYSIIWSAPPNALSSYDRDQHVHFLTNVEVILQSCYAVKQSASYTMICCASTPMNELVGGALYLNKVRILLTCPAFWREDAKIRHEEQISGERIMYLLSKLQKYGRKELLSSYRSA